MSSGFKNNTERFDDLKSKEPNYVRKILDGEETTEARLLKSERRQLNEKIIAHGQPGINKAKAKLKELRHTLWWSPGAED